MLIVKVYSSVKGVLIFDFERCVKEKIRLTERQDAKKVFQTFLYDIAFLPALSVCQTPKSKEQSFQIKNG